MFHKDNKSELFTPGFILVLHTFGRDLKWNPVVMKGNRIIFGIILINTGSGNDWPSEIAANVFDNLPGVAAPVLSLSFTLLAGT